MPRFGQPWITRRGLSALVACCCIVSCNFENEGEPPPTGRLYFPTGLALRQAEAGKGQATHLLVVNSNFDRRYNAGSVQSLDLDRLAEAARGDACPTNPLSRMSCVIQVTDTVGDSAARILVDEVVIGSLARGAALSSEHRFLYVASAADTGMTFIEIDDDGILDCGQGSGRRCSGRHVVGDDGAESRRGDRVPSDPVAITAGQFFDFRDLDFDTTTDQEPAVPREYAVIAYREGEVALFVHDLESDRVGLADVRAALVQNLTGLAYDAATGYLYVTTQRNIIGARMFLQRLGIAGNAKDPLDSAIFRGDPLELYGVPPGPNTWNAVFVERPAAADGGARTTGFIVSQVPNALLRVEMDASVEREVKVESIASVGRDAVRLAYAELTSPDGSETLEVAVVSSFLERQSRVTLVEAKTGRTIAIVPGISGAFDVVVDPPRQLLYVADFSASVIRIIDLEPVWSGGQPFLRATVGTPQVVEELQ